MGLSLHASRFGLAEHKRNQWQIVMPEGEAFETCLKPEYWAHVAGKLRSGDEITVLNDTMSFYGRLLVRKAERLWAQVCVIEKVELSEADTSSIESYEVDVEWAGPHDKHRVFRGAGANKAVLSKGHETREAAQKWAEDHKRTIGVKRAA